MLPFQALSRPMRTNLQPSTCRFAKIAWSAMVLGLRRDVEVAGSSPVTSTGRIPGYSHRCQSGRGSGSRHRRSRFRFLDLLGQRLGSGEDRLVFELQLAPGAAVPGWQG
jgi:hypothetical protein